LIEGTDGSFYGTTIGGGANKQGTFFKITSSGSLTTLYSFCSQPLCADGGYPESASIEASDGNFYGTTGNPATIYKITPEGVQTTLHTFAPGLLPQAALVQAADGDLYGTAVASTPSVCGVIFRITLSGAFTAVRTLTCNQVGRGLAGLTQGTTGGFYGVSTSAESGPGEIYSLCIGLGRFIETVYTYGKAGDKVQIIGRDLRGATNVRFNGVPAEFKILTRYDITTTVPHGATSGPVTVTTPSGTLTSNAGFIVLP
jgi:uncharacterized repeat protein (TIGR03803 family)